MNSLSDEIQILARLEIERALDNNELGYFATAIEETFNFPMFSMISEYFIKGAIFGASMEEETSEIDKDLFIFNQHEKMRFLLEKSDFNDTNEEEAVKLFERLFLQGMYWSITHRANNEN